MATTSARMPADRSAPSSSSFSSSSSSSPSLSPPSSSTSRRPAVPPTAHVPFTFILQHKDIRSVRDRRIQDPNHRHEIRSHVMRNVRQHESIQGVKRPTGGGRARKTNRAGKLTKPANGGSAAVKGDLYQQTLVVGKARSGTSAGRVAEQKRARFDVVDGYTLPLYAPLDVSDQLQRFCQRSDDTLSETAIRDLLTWGTSHFLPMTFPAEPELASHEFVQKALDASPATFFAFLATIACHRAVVYQQHGDLGAGDSSPSNCERISSDDFIRAHKRSIAEAQARKTRAAKEGRVDREYLEACFGIISTCTMAGDFQEAQKYVRIIRDEMQPGQLMSEEAVAWLPMTDIKVAVGLLSRPQVSIPWRRQPIDPDTLDHIRPAPSQPLSQAGLSFKRVGHLSSELQALLRNAVHICLMCDFNAQGSNSLTDGEHVLFRRKSVELEHDLLEYVYDIFPTSAAAAPPSRFASEPSVDIPPIENVVRLAVLGLMSIVSVYVLPGCGLGRALTRHQLRAIERWFATTTTTTTTTTTQQQQGHDDLNDEPVLRLIMWALFVFAKCAREQKEEDTFLQMLAMVTTRLQLLTWEQIEPVLSTFLYVPNMLQPSFYRTWEAVEMILTCRQQQQQQQQNQQEAAVVGAGAGLSVWEVGMMDEG